MNLTRTLIAALVLSSASITTNAQHAVTPESSGPVHYRVYDGQGNPSSFEALAARALESDVVLVGEEHNDPIAHWLQVKLLKSLLDEAGDRPVALSLEMFERDVQHVVDEYLRGQISESHFKKSGRAWSNYDTDYKPMVDAAIEAGIPVIAANAPRRYVNRVTREGAGSLEELSSRARSWLGPLPYEGASEEYAAQWNALMAEQMAEMQAGSQKKEAESEQGGSGQCMCRHGKGMRHGSGMSGGMCPHCKGMHGDSTAAGMHGKMSGMHGKKMKMHSDSTGMSGGMCPHCKGMHGDSTAAGMHQRVGPNHGKRMPDSDEAYRGMPDDETHRRFRPESEEQPEKNESAMTGAGGMHSMMSGMLDAQSLWDATMAHSIASFLESEPEALVMHAVGGFHVEYGTGIPEQLPVYAPDATRLIVAIRPADDLETFDEKDVGRGDFVILTDASLPRTYEARTE